jgi:hypothetical protein
MTKTPLHTGHISSSPQLSHREKPVASSKAIRGMLAE